jgi:hypothetical protein
MKKIIVALFGIIVACSTPKKAHPLDESIKEVITSQMTEPSNYQAVQTVAIDTFYTNQTQCAFEFLHTCLLKNKAGKEEMKSYFVQADTEMNIINVVDDPYKRFSNPCEVATIPAE